MGVLGLADVGGLALDRAVALDADRIGVGPLDVGDAGVVDAGDGVDGGTGLAGAVHAHAVAGDQVLAAVTAVGGQLVDLPAKRVELGGQRLAGGHGGGVVTQRGVGRGGQALGLVDHGVDGGQTLVGGLDGADRLAHRVLQRGQVAGTLVQALGGEEGGGTIQSRVDLVARRQDVLLLVDLRLRALQLQQVRAHRGGQGHITGHGPSLLLRLSPRLVI